MGVIYIDGFDKYATADILARWNQHGTYSGWSIGAYGRNSTNGLRRGGVNGGYIKQSIPAGTTFTVGFAFKTDSVAVGDPHPLVGFLLTGQDFQCSVSVMSGGQLAFYRGYWFTGAQVQLSTSLITTNTWYYIEVTVVIGNSGSYEVKVNGVTWLSGTGVDTQQQSAGNADALVIGGTGWWTIDRDDLYIRNDGTFIGDCRVVSSTPNGDGANTAWAASAGNDYECVDETTPNGDTDYISSSTAGQKDTFTFPDLTGTMNVKAVQTVISARKDNAGARNIREVCRSGGADYTGSSQAVSDTALFFRELRETDPNTAAAWDVAGVNAAEFGVELVS